VRIAFVGFVSFFLPHRSRLFSSEQRLHDARSSGSEGVPAAPSIGVALLDIADLLANPPIEPWAYLGEERAARFPASPTPPRPVIVFETERGLVLADGYHRVAAARRRGERTIAADVRLGSWEDALRYVAATAQPARAFRDADL
jgi:hypothetical protein